VISVRTDVSEERNVTGRRNAMPHVTKFEVTGADGWAVSWLLRHELYWMPSQPLFNVIMHSGF
jgi:hypothetical protein